MKMKMKIKMSTVIKAIVFVIAIVWFAQPLHESQSVLDMINFSLKTIVYLALCLGQVNGLFSDESLDDYLLTFAEHVILIVASVTTFMSHNVTENTTNAFAFMYRTISGMGGVALATIDVVWIALVIMIVISKTSKYITKKFEN